MRYLDRLINYIFSLIVLIVSIFVVLISTGFIEYSSISDYLQNNVFGVENNTLTCIIAIATFCAALKTTMFLSKTSPKKKTVLMVDTTHGKVQIASETIENTARNVAVSHEEVKDVQVKMVKDKKGVTVYMALLVFPHTNIIDLSSKVQDKVKEAIQSTTGVKVNNVDIKIKNIADKNGKDAKTAVKEEKVIVTPQSDEIVNKEVEKTSEDINNDNIEVNQTTVENSEENENM